MKFEYLQSKGHSWMTFNILNNLKNEKYHWDKKVKRYNFQSLAALLKWCTEKSSTVSVIVNLSEWTPVINHLRNYQLIEAANCENHMEV